MDCIINKNKGCYKILQNYLVVLKMAILRFYFIISNIKIAYNKMLLLGCIKNLTQDDDFQPEFVFSIKSGKYSPLCLKLITL